MDRKTGGRTIRVSRHTIPYLFIAMALLMLLAAAIIALRSGPDHHEVAKAAEPYTQESDNPLAVPLSDDQAECRARAFLRSDLSDGALDDVRNGQQPRPRNQHDIDVLNELAEVLADCL